jgi:hypothetical protein
MRIKPAMNAQLAANFSLFYERLFNESEYYGADYDSKCDPFA